MIKRYAKKDSLELHTNLYWLTGIKKDPTDFRWHIRYMKAENGELANTDGCQIRAIRIDLEDGFYIVTKRTKAVVEIVKEADLNDGSYPDYGDIFRVDENFEPVEVLDSAVTLDGGLSHIIRKMKEGTFALVRYMSITSDINFKEAYIDPEACKPLLLFTDGVRGALMPMRD